MNDYSMYIPFVNRIDLLRRAVDSAYDLHAGLNIIDNFHIHHTVLSLNVDRADLFGLKNTKTAAFNHHRTAHADVRIFSRDNYITTTQQGRVARETGA